MANKKIKAETGALEAGIRKAVEAAGEGSDVAFTYDYAGQELHTDVSADDTALDVRRRLFE